MSNVDSKKGLPLRGAFLLAACLVLGYYALVPKRTCFYRSARDASTNSAPWRSYLELNGRAKFIMNQPPEFIVREGSIYLLTRRTTSLPLFMALLHGEDKTWSVGQLRAISSSHPELKDLWPNGGASNLGVDWVSQDAK
jgi:hypothetical protein